jgi:ABC-type Fe3+-citrate transport system substrate-binding protein
LLREIRAKQDEHSERLRAIEERLRQVEKKLDSQAKVVRYSLGQSSETQFKQAEQETRINELFDQLESLLVTKEPS